MDLYNIWFLLLGVLLSGYAILDGFDLGVGILHLLAPTDHDRRLFLNAIGPIWDGNEVWLVVFGGALFAAFPEAYATVFSGFYLALMALIFALIFRAVSIEFRSKMQSRAWRQTWDVSFSAASLLASLLLGIAVGDAMLGIPLDARGVFTGRFVDLLHPYALMSGAVVVTMFAMHGSIYLYLKLPDGDTRELVRSWMWHTWGTFLALYVLGTIYTVARMPRALVNFERFPWAPVVVIVSVFAIANIPRAVLHGKPVQAFVSSSIAIVTLVTLFGLALYPNLVTASNNPTYSLTVYNAASSPYTLRNMLIFAMVGMPFVLVYFALVYRAFRGRVQLGDHSY
ncbi:MAG TPA: cytochrome d ubiquinol oxidase subunit II [Candidatus Acidoferrum sp.]|nr:cytochrome d ubiquinol oxidase subunit II [Candidatus Acidoferrum sp.]